MVSESYGHRLPPAHSPRPTARGASGALPAGRAAAAERRAGRSDARPGHGLSGISHCPTFSFAGLMGKTNFLNAARIGVNLSGH